MLERLCMVMLLLLASQAAAARADAPSPSRENRYCHAVVPATANDSPPAASLFTCAGEPQGYETRRLWLSADVSGRELGDGATFFVHQTRFDRLVLLFGYADGTVVRHRVSAGDYGPYWRVGGQLAFVAPPRETRLASVRVGIDGLAEYSLLRTRLLPEAKAARDSALAASLIGGALALLALSSGYNLLLARASRQRFVIWHAAWVASVLVWGLLWSQLALLVVPGLAGTTAARLCTLLATLAIAFAAACAATCPEPGTAPRWSRRLVQAFGWSVALIGVPVAFGPPVAIDRLGPILEMAVLGTLAAVTLLICVAWRRGSSEARTFFFAWIIPMLVLAATQLFDLGASLFGGGPQIAVLLASAFQTVWISIATTLRLGRFRSERDAARAAQAELKELAQRDPLTGLLNRRGFVERAKEALASTGGREPPFALLLIDVDHFKAINDRHGHDRGDAVLQRLARRLDELAGASCHAARLGGEEFALGVTGLSRPAVADFAERVRTSLGSLALADLLGPHAQVSVCIGIARADPASTFQTLYRRADEALYAAKNAGRNRVVHALEPLTDRAAAARMKAA